MEKPGNYKSLNQRVFSLNAESPNFRNQVVDLSSKSKRNDMAQVIRKAVENRFPVHLFEEAIKKQQQRSSNKNIGRELDKSEDEITQSDLLAKSIQEAFKGMKFMPQSLGPVLDHVDQGQHKWKDMLEIQKDSHLRGIHQIINGWYELFHPVSSKDDQKMATGFQIFKAMPIYLAAGNFLFEAYERFKAYEKLQMFEKALKDLQQDILKQAKLGNILEVFYADDGDLYASISPSTEFLIFPNLDSDAFIAKPTPIFQYMRFIFQGKQEKLHWGKDESEGTILFDSSYMLFFNTLMKIEQIRALVDAMSAEDRMRVENLAIREDIFFGKKNGETLEILAQFYNLKKVAVVFEVPSNENGKECLGPQAHPVERVDLFYLPSTAQRGLLPQSPIEVMMQTTEKLELWWKTLNRSTKAPVGDALAVRRNGIETMTSWREPTNEEIELKKRAEAEKLADFERNEKEFNSNFMFETSDEEDPNEEGDSTNGGELNEMEE